MSLRIHAIHLENFKSWYGQHTIELDANKFMAIVGANGSGKSNIIDALLFVFGWRARQLRQSKLVDLIHYSEQEPDYARVQVDFVNQGATFSVARTIRRQGNNFYEINGQKATLDSVVEILLQNGLDINHNRFLILEGEVESISMMKPSGDDSLQLLTQQELLNLQLLRDLTDRLRIEFDPVQFDQIYEYVYQNQEIINTDEAAQLYSKIVPIQAYQQEMQTSETGLLEFIEEIVGTQDQIPHIAREAALVQFIDSIKQETRNQLNELMMYRDQLNSAKDDAVSTIRRFYNDYIGHYNSVIYQVSNDRFIIQAKKDESQQFQKQIEQIEEESNVREMEAEINAIEQEIDVCQKQVDQFEKQQADAIQNLKQEQINLNLLNDKAEKKEAEISGNQKEEVTLNGEINELLQEFQDLPEKEHACEEEKEKLTNQISELTLQIEELQEQQQDQSAVQQIKEEINILTEKLAPISEEKAGLESTLEISKSGAASKLNTLIAQIGLIGANIVEIYDNLNVKNVKITQLINERADIEQQLSAINHTKLQKDKCTIEGQMSNCQLSIDNINLEINEINANEQSNINQNKLVSFLLTNKAEGVIGRLGDLGEISEQLNLAAVAAFGGQLDYIVCKNMDSIQNCLALIKENNLGYASFIDLQQVTKRYHTQSQSRVPPQFISENNGYLFLDLVKCDPQVKPAFWHVMGDIIITDNNKSAIALNKGINNRRLRVVTQDGELFEKSGSLTGGGTAGLLNKYSGFKKARTDDESDAKELTQLGKEREGLAITLDNLKERLMYVKQEIDRYNSLKQANENIAEQISENEQIYTRTFGNIARLTQQVNQINDEPTVLLCGAYVNPTILEELAELEKAVQSGEEHDIQELKHLIPNVSEIAQYYKQQGYVDMQEVNKYLQSKEHLFILQGDNDFSNLLEFKQDIALTLNLEQAQEVQEELKVLCVQAENYQRQIDALNNELNNQSQVKEYEKIRRLLNQHKDQLKKCEDEIAALAVLEKRFEPSKDRLIGELSEVEGSFDRLVADEEAIKLQIQDTQAKMAEMENTRTQIKNQLSTENSILQSLNEQFNTQTEMLNQLNQQLNKLTNLIAENTKEINSLVDAIAGNERLFEQANQVLELIGTQLAKAQETVEYQIPLYSTHENQEELSAYDQFVLTNLQQCKPHLKNFAQINSDYLNGKFVTEFRVLTDYEQRVQNLMRQEEIFAQIEQDYDGQLVHLNEVKQARQEEFLNSFNEINSRLREIYRVFSMGGDATLEFIDSFDPFEGITYSVMPPKKAWRSIQNLSGGEKTLSSLSLIFALHEYKKNFIYVVDEIDAALDFRNVSLVANYLKEQARECQFVIISLRNNTFEVADKLIGVYKVNNISNCVTLDIE